MKSMVTALYRKYRPTTFDDVIGQDHIVRTLKNQIANGRIGHAYLFTGSRGTGKTTCAKIFARAINCLHPVDGSPCGKCEVCRALEDAANLDVTEIDAASNNGVDDAREIREQVKYPPINGKYKVYIIDEVHMLTGSAFNALLKTLEEPPAHAVFILATTEAHKLPATILSRCMRFDFRLVSVDNLSKRIAAVFDAEGKAYEPEAVRYIAQAGQGSVRDALSVADMCFNYSTDKLTYADCLEVLGATDSGKLRALFDAVANGDFGAAFAEIDEMARLGKSIALIARDLTRYARDLLVVKTGNTSLVLDTEENIAAMKKTAETCSVDLLVAVVRIFSEIDAELRYSVNPRIVLETACVRAAKLASTDLAAVTERVERLERAVQNGVVPTAPVAATVNATASTAPQADKPRDAHSVWGRMTTYMRTNGSMRLYALIGEHREFTIDGDKLVIYANNEKFLEFSDPETVATIDRFLASDGDGLTVKVVRRDADGDALTASVEKLKKMMDESMIKKV